MSILYFQVTSGAMSKKDLYKYHNPLIAVHFVNEMRLSAVPFLLLHQFVAVQVKRFLFNWIKSLEIVFD